MEEQKEKSFEEKPCTDRPDGIYHDITNQEYHSNHLRVSKSGLSLLAKSPYHFKFFQHENTSALNFGSAYHAFILEPEKFHSLCSVAPKVNKRTNAGKEEYANFLNCNEGKVILDPEELIDLCAMRDVMAIHQIAMELIDTPGHVELSIYWTEPETGVKCKVRLDKYIPSTNQIIDLKTTQSVSAAAFQASVRKYGYDLQDAFYTDGARAAGLNVDDFYFLAQESKYPHGVGVYTMDQVTREAARRRYMELLHLYRDCSENNYWPMVNMEEVTVLSLAA
jgi:exodeoxyribonuclease VIII